MNAIIIEDEKLSAIHLTNLLKKIDTSIQVIANYDSVKSTVQAFKNGMTCDLLFVDIHLADGISFDIFQKVNIDIPVIFTTAYDEYAIKAFKLNSVDYLLKPIDVKELKVAIEKFQKNSRPQLNILSQGIADVYNKLNSPYKNRFMVKLGDNIVSLKVEDVIYFVYEDGTVILTSNANKRYAVDYTMDNLESLVNPSMFFRINRKVLININAIKKVGTYFNSRLIITAENLEGDDGIVSRDRVNDFKLWLDQ